MGKSIPDIKDDEIRIISSRSAIKTSEHQDPMPKKASQTKRRFGWQGVLLVVTALIACALVMFILLKPEAHNDDLTQNIVHPGQSAPGNNTTSTNASKKEKSFVTINDTIINGIKLQIYTPVNATPRLHVGPDILNDSSNAFVVQAADVRGDNGEILGAFVLKGQLLSKGQSKSGYCAIINGKINIGVSDTTPLLEQALETNGYFFRQYPLVVSNQIVENKPNNKSQRKALAELNGNIVVIMTQERILFYDFSKALVDMGVNDAIYLIGSTSYGYTKDAYGKRVDFGERVENPSPNTNYLVWQ